MPGETATFANYSSYSLGINGVMIDVAGLAGTPTADDFAFHVGNGGHPNSWTPVAAEPTITVRPGEGADGSDRVVITFDDGAVANQWLEVAMFATARTGLPETDLFYFGNAVAEAGDSTEDAKVNVADMLLARNNPRTFLDPAPIDFAYDYNRDGRVNATDMLLARNNPTNFLNALKLIDVPPG
jgi:hypothetical protein